MLALATDMLEEGTDELKANLKLGLDAGLVLLQIIPLACALLFNVLASTIHKVVGAVRNVKQIRASLPAIVLSDLAQDGAQGGGDAQALAEASTALSLAGSSCPHRLTPFMPSARPSVHVGQAHSHIARTEAGARRAACRC